MSDNLKDLLEYLRDWKDRFKGAQEVVPEVQKILDQSEWMDQMLKERPPEVFHIPTDPLEEYIDRTHKIVLDNLPMLPEINPKSVTFANTVTATSTDSAAAFVVIAGDVDSPRAKEFATIQMEKYQRVHFAVGRYEDVRGRMRKVFPDRVELLEVAERAYYAAKGGTGDRTAAATEMRNLLETIKGDLWQRARRTPKENMTWEKMADRLLLDPIRNQELKRRESIHNALYGELSTIAKMWEGPQPRDLDDVWARWLDHLFIVSGLLD